MSDVADWLIRKGAYFYCPNKSGYTTVKSQAGRYTELDARREAEIEPWHMEAIHQDNVPDPVGDINVSEIAALKATLDSKDKALAEAQEQAKHYPTVAGENMRLREEIAEIRAENERWCDAAQATSAKLTAANAELARVRKAIEAGKLLANAAFNIHQMGATDANSLRSLKEAQVAWDDALLASLAERAA